MKKIISVFCIAAMLMVTLSFTACGGGQDLTGSYKLVEMASGEEDMSSLLESINVYMTVEDNHATLDFMGQTMEWEVDTQAQVMRGEDGSEAPYRVEGNQIILENQENGSNNKMVFEKQ